MKKTTVDCKSKGECAQRRGIMRINKAIMIYYRKMGSRGFGPHGLSALTCRVFIVEGQSTWEEKYYLSNANPA